MKIPDATTNLCKTDIPDLTTEMASVSIEKKYVPKVVRDLLEGKTTAVIYQRR